MGVVAQALKPLSTIQMLLASISPVLWVVQTLPHPYLVNCFLNSFSSHLREVVEPVELKRSSRCINVFMARGVQEKLGLILIATLVNVSSILIHFGMERFCSFLKEIFIAFHE